MRPTTDAPTYGDESAEHPAWSEVERLLTDAELYWLSTVRPDGRPHVTPLVGVWHDGTLCFTTGEEEQKQQNLQANARVALTTGTNTWASGTDVVVEGAAERLTGLAATTPYAAAFGDKYGKDWGWVPTESGFAWPDGGNAAGEGDVGPLVYVVRPAKVLVFAKEPHGQTVFVP